MHKQRFKIGSLVTSWKAGQIIFNDFNTSKQTFYKRECFDNNFLILQ